MRIYCRNVLLVFLLTWLLIGCGDEQAASTTVEASAASTPTMSPSSTSKPNVQTSATNKVVQVKEAPFEKQVVQPEEKALAPETPEQIQAQCQGLLKSAWKGLGPAFNALKIENYAALESDYFTGYDGRKFVKVCTFLSRDDRACLAAASNPVDAMHPCQIDSSKTKGKTLTWPTVPGESPLFKAAKRPKAEQSALIKRMKGVWKNKTGFRSETWTIDGVGKVAVERFKTDGTPEKTRATDNYTLSFPTVLHAKRLYERGSFQHLTFLMVGESEFYASGNLLYGAYDLKDGKTFVFKALYDWGIVQDGRCTIVTKAGQVLDATCVQSDETFTVTYQIPGKKRWRQETFEPTEVTYPVVNNHALAPQLVKMGHFTKKP